MTDEELDALQESLSKLGGHGFPNWADDAVRAITALRAQLAEARGERDDANKILDDWTTLHRVIADIRDAAGLGSRPMLSELAGEIGRRIAAANARADRAEAERAAQIDRAAAIARLEAIAQAAENAGLPDRRDGLRDAIFAISTIPAVQHAALAEAREKALREAAEMVRGTAYTSSNVGRRLEPVSPAMAGMDMHHATIADAILAMIDKP